MMGSKGEFDVFKEHTDVWNVGSFGDIADVGQRGGNAGGERAVNISALLKGSFFFFWPQNCRIWGLRGYFWEHLQTHIQCFSPPTNPVVKRTRIFPRTESLRNKDKSPYLKIRWDSFKNGTWKSGFLRLIRRIRPQRLCTRNVNSPTEGPFPVDTSAVLRNWISVFYPRIWISWEK